MTHSKISIIGHLQDSNMAICPLCKEDGLLIERIPGLTPIGDKKLTSFFCNVCGHSWKVLESVK